jgi:hypothetical protein
MYDNEYLLRSATGDPDATWFGLLLMVIFFGIINLALFFYILHRVVRSATQASYTEQQLHYIAELLAFQIDKQGATPPLSREERTMLNQIAEGQKPEDVLRQYRRIRSYLHPQLREKLTDTPQ